MDIGPEFDDDFFEKPREREGSQTSNYEAKIRVPLWYMETPDTTEPDETLVALKHQADFFYYSQNYAKAAETYEKCLQLVPSGNNTWKREFMENLSRCCLQLGKAEKALEWSFKLHDASFSPDQKVVSMNLLATVCHNLGKYKEELEALHCCIHTHKSCPEFWLRLGLCYSGLFKIDLPGCSLVQSSLEGDQEPCCAFNCKSACRDTPDKAVPTCSSDSAIASTSTSSTCTENCSTEGEDEDSSKCDICTLGVQIVSSCLIHTKMLMDSGGPNPLGAERDEKIREKIASSLKYMEVGQSFIDVASTMLGADFLSGLQESRDTVEQQESIIDQLKAEKVE